MFNTLNIRYAKDRPISALQSTHARKIHPSRKLHCYSPPSVSVFDRKKWQTTSRLGDTKLLFQIRTQQGNRNTVGIWPSCKGRQWTYMEERIRQKSRWTSARCRISNEDRGRKYLLFPTIPIPRGMKGRVRSHSGVHPPAEVGNTSITNHCWE